MDFSSDTAAPVHPAVLAAHEAANSGPAPSYGADPWSARLTDRLKEVFETDRLAVSVVGSGTASNCLALSLLAPPHCGVLCHALAHINTHERGAPEFYTGGAKLLPLTGSNARIDYEPLKAAIEAIDPGFVHTVPAVALSLSNLSESGAVYTAERTAERAALAHGRGLRVHIDGARLANALAFTGASPADLTWRAGADVLSLGLTKTGAASAEMVVLFGDMADRHGELEARRKRSGHMPPKARFAAAEALALFEDDLWLTLARAANASAQRLVEALSAFDDAEILHPVEGNLIFVRLAEHRLARLEEAGVGAYARQGAARLVCSWNTTDADVDALIDALQ